MHHEVCKSHCFLFLVYPQRLCVIYNITQDVVSLLVAIQNHNSYSTNPQYLSCVSVRLCHVCEVQDIGNGASTSVAIVDENILLW